MELEKQYDILKNEHRDLENLTTILLECGIRDLQMLLEEIKILNQNDIDIQDIVDRIKDDGEPITFNALITEMYFMMIEHAIDDLHLDDKVDFGNFNIYTNYLDSSIELDESKTLDKNTKQKLKKYFEENFGEEI